MPAEFADEIAALKAARARIALALAAEPGWPDPGQACSMAEAAVPAYPGTTATPTPRLLERIVADLAGAIDGLEQYAAAAATLADAPEQTPAGAPDEPFRTRVKVKSPATRSLSDMIPLVAPLAARPPRTGPPDDLTRIRGIDPSTARRLAGLGIRHFGDIANWSSSDVHRVSDALELGRGISRLNWIEQAAQLDRAQLRAIKPDAMVAAAVIETDLTATPPAAVSDPPSAPAIAVHAALSKAASMFPPDATDAVPAGAAAVFAARVAGSPGGIPSAGYLDAAANLPIAQIAPAAPAPDLERLPEPVLAAIVDDNSTAAAGLAAKTAAELASLDVAVIAPEPIPVAATATSGLLAPVVVHALHPPEISDLAADLNQILRSIRSVEPVAALAPAIADPLADAASYANGLASGFDTGVATPIADYAGAQAWAPVTPFARTSADIDPFDAALFAPDSREAEVEIIVHADLPPPDDHASTAGQSVGDPAHANGPAAAHRAGLRGADVDLFADTPAAYRDHVEEATVVIVRRRADLAETADLAFYQASPLIQREGKVRRFLKALSGDRG